MKTWCARLNKKELEEFEAESVTRVGHSRLTESMPVLLHTRMTAGQENMLSCEPQIR